MLVGIQRVIKSGFVNFRRNGVISWASVLVTTITLSVIISLILLQAVLHFSLEEIKNKVDVTIYFNVGAPQDKINALEDSIKQLPEVASVSYTSSEQALTDFKDRHSNDYSTIQALDEINSNPLGGYLNVKAKEVSQYETIASFLKSDNALALDSASIIYKVTYYQNKLVIDKLNSITLSAEKLGFIVTLLLVLTSIAITFNTIRLTIFFSREEIGIMQLVGASKWGVRGPFLVEGAIYGMVATILALVLFWPATFWLGRNMTSFLGINIYQYYISNILYIAGIALLSGVSLGIVSSFLAIRKYLSR